MGTNQRRPELVGRVLDEPFYDEDTRCRLDVNLRGLHGRSNASERMY